MTKKPTGPACGNNPNYPLADGDRQAIADFRAYLDSRAALTRVRALADAIDTEMRTEPDTQRAAMQHEAVVRIRAALDGHPLLSGEQQAAAPSAPADQASVRDAMGPADGQQKMRLLDRLYASTAPVDEPDDRNLRDLRRIVDRLAAHARGFQDVLDESDRGPWARLVRADIDALRTATAALSAPADRAAVLREAADTIAHHPGPVPYRPQLDEDGGFWWDTRDRDAVVVLLRRMADEAQQTEPAAGTAKEDPARIDRLRPEFTDHSSVEAIDAQLRRARSQERRWHIRTEWLLSLRQARIAQKENGEWPAATQNGAQP